MDMAGIRRERPVQECSAEEDTTPAGDVTTAAEEEVSMEDCDLGNVNFDKLLVASIK